LQEVEYKLNCGVCKLVAVVQMWKTVFG
jgi:hypothetical protein